jgi:hypothetical protein
VGDVPLLFQRLVDDAALFPPGNAPMAAAVPAHLRRPTEPFAALVGPFLCPASRVTELRSVLPADARMAVGLIVDTGLGTVEEAVAAVRADDRLELRMVEVPVPPGDDDLVTRTGRAMAQVPAEVKLYVELPRVTGWRVALDHLGAANRGAKLRTGGLRAELFPSTGELAAFLTACADRQVPFKCTAGLHHAVHHADPTSGFVHHGFLNLVVASARAIRGGQVEDALAEERPERLAVDAAAIDAPAAAATRALFVSYGSCDVQEPVADLLALGLLTAP